MIPPRDEKQIAVKLNEQLIDRLDALARNGGMNRNHLMSSFVNVWLSALEKASMPSLFYIANLFRVRENQMHRMRVYEHEFTELRLPEKPLPLKFTESDIFRINSLACVNHISRHLLLKTMIIVGIEDLENKIDSMPFQFGALEPELYKSFSIVMQKGDKSFRAYLK